MNESTPAPPIPPINNALYLRRRKAIVVPTHAMEAAGADSQPSMASAGYVATALKNLESLGYGFSDELVAACRALPLPQVVALYEEVVTTLQKLKGAHQMFAPMYPNFPEQVMETSEAELYLNAIVHYWSSGRLFPDTEVKERPSLSEGAALTPIGLGSVDGFTALFGQIVGANTAFSEQDREDVAWFVQAYSQTYGDAISGLLPAAIPQKENAATVAGLLLGHVHRERAVELVGVYTKTATDVLRVAVAMSGGDVSLATASKFRTFSRPQRVLLLALIERLPYASAVEDMLRWPGRWLRLGEKLHPREYATRFPNTARAFEVLRSDLPFATFNSGVEKALAGKDAEAALVPLRTRPGDLARRLDHLLRLAEGDGTAQGAVLTSFVQVAPQVSTPVLLQVRQHFANRGEAAEGNASALRVFFPKGNVAKAQSIPNTLPILPRAICEAVVTACESALTARFAALPALGMVYVDPRLQDYMVPFALRSASKSLRTLVRGSRLPLPECSVLRFFVWWKNKGEGGNSESGASGNSGRSDRTDIDLSAAMFDDAFQFVSALSYYNLKDMGGVHSGDIVDAPEGASEFIDVTLDKLREKNVRYVVMVLTSYTGQPFVTLPECFAGWMARQAPGSGEIFEPRTVEDRLDMTADTKVSIPLLIDVVDGKVIWCDMALRQHPRWGKPVLATEPSESGVAAVVRGFVDRLRGTQSTPSADVVVNNVAGNLGGIAATLCSLVETGKPNLYDLFRLHAEARGTLVATAEEAAISFSVENGAPFRLEEIAADYMA